MLYEVITYIERSLQMKRVFCCLTAAVLLGGLTACAGNKTTEIPEATAEIVTVETQETQNPETTAPEVIEFNDDVLEGLIREAMNRPTGEITSYNFV